MPIIVKMNKRSVCLSVTLLVSVVISVLPVRAAAEPDPFQCRKTGGSEAVVSACSARFQAANVRAHVAAGDTGGSNALCLVSYADLLEQLAASWAGLREYHAYGAPWPCGSQPAFRTDDGVLAKACPDSVWSYDNAGATRCFIDPSGYGRTAFADFGGTKFCRYTAALSIDSIAVTIGPGHADGHLHATMVESTPACPYAPLGTRSDAYEITNSVVSNGQVALYFLGDPQNVPLNDAVFVGSRKGNILTGTFTFTRTDSVQELHWVISIPNVVIKLQST